MKNVMPVPAADSLSLAFAAAKQERRLPGYRADRNFITPLMQEQASSGMHCHAYLPVENPIISSG